MTLSFGFYSIKSLIKIITTFLQYLHSTFLLSSIYLNFLQIQEKFCTHEWSRFSLTDLSMRMKSNQRHILASLTFSSPIPLFVSHNLFSRANCLVIKGARANYHQAARIISALAFCAGPHCRHLGKIISRLV